MTYQIDISAYVYMNWTTAKEWSSQNWISLPRSITFDMWMEQHNPEIIEMSDQFNPSESLHSYRTFTFESEAHYHWFLLRQ